MSGGDEEEEWGDLGLRQVRTLSCFRGRLRKVLVFHSRRWFGDLSFSRRFFHRCFYRFFRSVSPPFWSSFFFSSCRFSVGLFALHILPVTLPPVLKAAVSRRLLPPSGTAAASCLRFAATFPLGGSHRCLSACLSVCLSVCPSVCLSMLVTVCISVFARADSLLLPDTLADQPICQRGMSARK